MASEQSKSPTEHPPPPQAAPIMAYPPPYGAGHYAPMPPGAYGQPIYTLAPMQADPNHDPNGANGAPPPGPYLMAFPPPPPGLVYAYAPPPPHGQPFMYPPYATPPISQARPKRKQVKMACTNCAAACKRCDDARPCERCQKYGVADSCKDGQRKERKKGIKRGPYKRKSKASSDQGSTYSGQPAGGSSGEGEAVVPPAPYPFPPPAESYYPYFYPPNFAPHPHEAQSNGDGNAAHPVPPPVFPLHPAVYPPYAQYPHPGVPYPPPAGTPATAAPADLNGKSAEAETNGEASSSRKKSSRTSKAGDDGKKKKGKDNAAGTSGANGHTEAPAGQPGSPAEAAYATSGSHGGIGNRTEHRHVVSPV